MTADDLAAQSRAYFSADDVVADYEADVGLTPPEQYLVDRHVTAEDALLDLGVGAGRTTEVLAPLVRRYVGIDYAAGMVDACARRFPDLDIRLGDASNLSEFGYGEFDVALFSFNGIDSIHPLEQRHACFREMHRVLRPGGTAILSSHNVRGVVRPIDGRGGLGGRIQRLAKQSYSAGRFFSRSAAGGAFFQGGGYVHDTATSLVLYMCTRQHFVDEAHRAGFRVLDILGSDHPSPPRSLHSAWFYYALRRP